MLEKNRIWVPLKEKRERKRGRREKERGKKGEGRERRERGRENENWKGKEKWKINDEKKSDRKIRLDYIRTFIFQTEEKTENINI